MISLKMLVIYQMLTMITNKEMFFQQGISMIHKVKLTLRTLLCNQETENTQSFLWHRANLSTISQRTLRTFQIPTIIINKEMFFLQVTTTAHKVKLTLKITPCNQEIAIGIQLCLMKKKTRRVISISIIINTITRMLKMIKKFKSVLNLKKLMLH